MGREDGANHIEGNLSAAGKTFGVVAARFNGFVVDSLLEGALDAVRRHGGDVGAVDVAWVPGSYEIPLVARKMAATNRYDAVICVGALIRGGTIHFDVLSAEVTKGVAQAALETGVPITFGVITTDTLEQAIERAGTKMGNKGWEAAESAIELVNLLKAIK